jgi:nucleoside phosphorylase
MTTGELRCPCVVFALAREAMAFWKSVQSRSPIGFAPCRAWWCRGAAGERLVLETGLGRKAMEAAVQWALSDARVNGQVYRPTSLVLAGFSGALVDDLAPGDLVLASDILAEGGENWHATWPATATTSLRRGTLLTVDGLVTDPARKRELGRLHGALAVDMESASAARLCQESGVPFGCLRAISDRVDTPLPSTLVDLLRSGRPSAAAVTAACLRQPRIVAELWRLARDTRIAAHQLDIGVRQLLAAIEANPGSEA